MEPASLPGELAQLGERVRVVRSVPEIEEIRDIWTAWQWHPNADIDFYLQVLRSGPGMLQPHVLVLYRDGSPVAMLVGRLVQTQMETRLGYASLIKTQVRSLTFIYGGQAGDLSPENSKILIAEIMRSLREGEADLASFRFVRTHSPLHQMVARCPGFFMRDRFPQVQSHWSMMLPSKQEATAAVDFRRGKADLRRNSKKLMEQFGGNVRVHCFRRPEELDRMFRDVEEVARKTYHRGLGFGFVDNAEMRERTQLEAEKGWLRAYVLYLADQPAAFWIGSVYGGKFFSGDTGYDDAYKRQSPGMFLLTWMFEEFWSEGVKEVDFGLGDAEYKRRFGTCSWDEASINIFAPTFKGLRIGAFRAPAIFIDQTVKKALDRTQVLPRIKKLWRDHARQAGKRGSREG
jgi:Acetyltransferase (GNAT) domain